MKCTPTRQANIRMTAIRALLLGQDPQAVATIFDISSRTLTRWVGDYNESGIDGLIDKPRSGRPRAIDPEKDSTLRELIEHPELAGQTHWTARKFHGHLCAVMNEEVGYRTVVRWLQEQDFRLLVPRPWPDRQDEQARQAHVEQVAQWLLDDTVELWWADESGFEGDPRPRRRWAKKGSAPTRVKNGDHLRTNVLGAICPRTGEFSGIEVDCCNTACFQVFLDEANRDLTFVRPTNLLLVDNASWHKVKSLQWGHFTPVYLPAYSPDLNPIERLWRLIKDEWFSDFVAKGKQHLIERVEKAMLWALGRPEQIQATCTIKTRL